MSEKNCKELAKQGDIDGFLVGGASLKPACEFVVTVVVRSVLMRLQSSTLSMRRRDSVMQDGWTDSCCSCKLSGSVDVERSLAKHAGRMMTCHAQPKAHGATPAY